MNDKDRDGENRHTDAGVRHRSLRSFVRREGRITQGQRRALDTLLPNYRIDADVRDATREFTQEAPVCVEVGFGNGDALLNMAASRPDWNFIGVEVYRPGVGKLLLGLDAQQICNVRVSTDDVVDFLTNACDSQTLDAIYIFFPDPWPKKKHKKRRLVNADFVELCTSRLRSGGRLHIATDIEEYAEEIGLVLNEQPRLVRCRTIEAVDADTRYPTRPETKYERRGQRLGHGIRDIVYTREGANDA